MGWEDAFVDLVLVGIAAIALIAALVFLARHAHRGAEPVFPHHQVDPPASLGPLLDLVSSSSPGLQGATRTDPDATTSSEPVDEILLAYAEGDLTTDAAAKELVDRLEVWALDSRLDLDKELRAAVARELHARGLA